MLSRELSVVTANPQSKQLQRIHRIPIGHNVSLRKTMKMHSMLVGYGLVCSIASFDIDSPGKPELPITVQAVKSNSRPGCVTKCWDYSKYVSTCATLDEESCLCEDGQFQNVGTDLVLILERYRSLSNRLCFNACTLNVRLHTSAPRCITRFPHALTSTLIIS